MMFSRQLAPYACHWENSKGRFFEEPESVERTAYMRDRDRIVHSAAFRRLKFKTQVFVYHEGDHYRTRLTHTLEVAQISRTIARRLGLDEDLAEALALAHDLGHPPFGHAGEAVLNECLKPFGGFDHNVQTVKILTSLERRYMDFDGLNLSWECLEGIVKHNGPPKPSFLNNDYIKKIMSQWDLDVVRQSSLEAQVAALADDIAYDNHDVDDALRAGLLHIMDVRHLPIFGDTIAAIHDQYPGRERERVIFESVRRLIGMMVDDVVNVTRENIAKLGIGCVEEVRSAPHAIVAFSPSMLAAQTQLKKFMFENVYRHWRVNRSTSKAKRIIRDLCHIYMSEPQILPDDWRGIAEAADHEERALIVGDFIAGMTDRFAMVEHRRLFDLTEGQL